MWFYFCYDLESMYKFTNFLCFSDSPENLFTILVLTMIVIGSMLLGVCFIMAQLGVLILALASVPGKMRACLGQNIFQPVNMESVVIINSVNSFTSKDPRRSFHFSIL